MIIEMELQSSIDRVEYISLTIIRRNRIITDHNYYWLSKDHNYYWLSDDDTIPSNRRRRMLELYLAWLRRFDTKEK